MDYDTWKQICCEDFYDTPEDNGYIHEDDVPDLSECKKAIEDIVAILYSDDGIDCKKLDNCVGYLADEFRVTITKDKPNVMRCVTEKEESKTRWFNWYTWYTREHAEINCRR